MTGSLFETNDWGNLPSLSILEGKYQGIISEASVASYSISNSNFMYRL